MIYFTSNMHLGHEAVIHMCNRPFKNAEEMNQVLIHNFNSIVHKNDTDLIGILSRLSENYEIIAQFGVQGRRDYQQYFAVRNMLEKVEFVYRCILRK